MECCQIESETVCKELLDDFLELKYCSESYEKRKVITRLFGHNGTHSHIVCHLDSVMFNDTAIIVYEGKEAQVRKVCLLDKDSKQIALLNKN